MADLVLFSRQGCCLCEGLEQRLRDLDLQALGAVSYTHLTLPTTPYV